MLKKLLKYDFKNMYKFLVVFYTLTIFFAITTRIITLFKETVFINIIYQISIGCLCAMLANVIINTLMRNWVRFKETLYGDEAYLTHTLPITKNTLYTSKFILSIVTTLSSFIVIILSLFIAFYNKENIDFIKSLLLTIPKTGISTTLLIIAFIIIIYLELYNGLESGFIGIILGHKRNSNKTLFSVIYGFITYLVSQIICFIPFLIIAIFNKKYMQILTTNNIDMSIISSLIIISLVSYITVIILEKFIATKELNKGINID